MGAVRSVIVSLAVFLAVVTVVFQVVTTIGGLDRTGLRDLYFLRINTTNIVPETRTPLAGVLNTVASELGLQDYYQTSLWTYCYGRIANNDVADFGPIAGCNASSTSYYFNPVDIISQSLYSGASVAIPEDIQNDLDLIRRFSTALKALCIAGACLGFLTMVFALAAYGSRLASFFTSIVAFLSAACNVVAAVIAQVLFVIVRNVINNNIEDLNVEASLGTTLFALIWVAAGASLVTFVLLLFTICCCSPGDRKRRDRHVEKEAQLASYGSQSTIR